MGVSAAGAKKPKRRGYFGGILDRLAKKRGSRGLGKSAPKPSSSPEPAPKSSMSGARSGGLRRFGSSLLGKRGSTR